MTEKEKMDEKPCAGCGWAVDDAPYPYSNTLHCQGCKRFYPDRFEQSEEEK